MKPTVLTPINKQVIIEYAGDEVQLPSERKGEIEDFWLEINRDGTFQRGEIFHVCSIIEQEDLCKVLLKHTDYAHYLHTVRNYITDEEGCKVVYGAGLVETNDCKYIFGEMGNHTAYPGRLQCVGGGLSSEDRNGNYFDMKQSVLRELAEELGVQNSDRIESCIPKFIKAGGPYDFIVILFHIKLRDTAEEFFAKYDNFTETIIAQGEKPEFHNIICIDNSREAVLNFLENDTRQSVDYLRPLLKQMVALH